MDKVFSIYISAKFNLNSLNNNRENSLQQVCQECVIMTLTFDLRPWNFQLFTSQVLPTIQIWERSSDK